MTNKTGRRARRIAADEAHAWARNLRLNNSQAKLVLSMTTLYVDGDGYCFVAIPSLADDTELSAQTVRRRLAWLEEIGAIIRLPQWIDDKGVRNGDGRGKRTSDLMKLMLDADTDEIEARAAGLIQDEESGHLPAQSDVSASEISPIPQTGLTDGEISAGPTAALPQPYHCGEGLISEPEPEISPRPPSGESVDIEGWKEFQEDWAEPILRQSLAQHEFAKLTPEDRTLVRQAARGYVAWRKAQRKPPNVLGAHLFLRERDAWAGFAAKAPDAGMAVSIPSYPVESREGRALLALCDLARGRLQERGNRVFYAGSVTPQVLAFADPPEGLRSKWAEDREQIGAWLRFLGSFDFGNRANIVQTRGIGDNQRRGVWVPNEWPPRVNGSWGPPEAGLSEADAENFK